MMKDPILITAQRYLVPVIVILSLVVLWRGHNLPGGGFIGGLIASMAGVLIFLSEGGDSLRKRLRFSPQSFMTVGLALALFSALWGLFQGMGFFTAQWLPAVYLPIVGKILLGTPLIFDVGVYLVVIGFTLSVLLKFAIIDQWKS